jgi:hypothetical protein
MAINGHLCNGANFKSTSPFGGLFLIEPRQDVEANRENDNEGNPTEKGHLSSSS